MPSPALVVGTRLGAALALALSVAAVALATAALMTALRDDGGSRGRLIQTRLVPSESDPVFFPLGEFYASTGGDGVLRALYVYPPGFYGHERGCRVVWAPAGAALSPGQTPVNGAGEFLDPCSGDRFASDGTLIMGAGGRGLDRFKTEPGIEGVIVDTRVLYCGPPYAPAAPTAAAEASTPEGFGDTPSMPGQPPPLATATPEVTATPPATPTSQRPPLEECGRVSPDVD
jgi:hypothetical protein